MKMKALMCHSLIKYIDFNGMKKNQIIFLKEYCS